MRVAILVLSVCIALFFAVSFGLTFFAKPYITRLAQDFIADKTQRVATPAVDHAEKALGVPRIKLVLDDKAIQTTQREIADYRRDPRAYIIRLMAAEQAPAPAVAPDQAVPLKERALHWKAQIREHFERTLDRLLLDLRIFSGSNLVAALLAAWCALRAREKRVHWLIGVAALLLASMAFGIYMYVDSFSYFRILMNIYIGWRYPVVLATTFLALYLVFGRRDLHAPSKPMQMVEPRVCE
jgi:hypothetical protein